MRCCLFSTTLFTATLAAQQTTQLSQPKAESCSIEGQVVNAITGEPLTKAAIDLSAVGHGQEARYDAVTTSGGRFVIRDIEPGQYRMRANKRGYAAGEYSASGTSRTGTTLSLDPGQQLKNVVLRMSPQAVITGRALDDDGEPLPNVGVYLFRYTFRRGKRQLEECDQANTNDLGEYRMFGLSPGRYYLSATPNDFGGSRQQYDSGRGYAPVYYPGATDSSGAKPIDLDAGTLLRGLDITMIKTRTVHVRGHVVDPTPKQNAQGIGVNLQPRDESRYMFGGQFFSGVDPQGNFEIKSVVPGEYFVVAFKRVGTKQYRAQQPVDVHESDVENVVLEFSPPAELKGQLRYEGRTVVNPGEIRIWLEEEHRAGGAMGHMRPDGSFTITDVQASRYQVNIFGQPDDCYLKSVRLGDQEVVESGLDLTHGIGGSLEITLSGNGGQVEGVVLNAGDQPETGATVVLVPDEARRSQLRLYKDVTTDQYGRFTMKGIAPGGYKLFAWEEIEDGAYQNPDFLKTFEALGEPQTMREGSYESAQLKLIPAAGKRTAATN
jgi:protocatechuate 3,4-dioxygenase beta subunit